MLGKAGPCRNSIASSAILALAILSSAPSYASEKRVNFSIPAQPLPSALIAFSRQSGQLIIADPALLRDIQSKQLIGTFLPSKALRMLLGNSGLVAVERQDGGYVIQQAAAKAKTAKAARIRPSRTPSSKPVGSVKTIPSNRTDRGDLDGEIIVTARLKEEVLGDVPISMTVLNHERLERTGANSVQDIVRSVPGTEFRDSASNKDRSILIRGVGTVSTSPGVEPSVSMVVDDVVLSRPGQATIDLQDIERVEIIRGPQGTLFGKNASAGVLNIVSRAPSNVFGAEGLASATTDGEQRITGRITGPIGNGLLRYSLSGLVKRYKGNQINLANDSDINGSDREGARFKLQAGDTSHVQITLGLDYLNTREDVPNGTFIASARTNPPDNRLNLNPLLSAILAEGSIAPSKRNTQVRSNFNSRVSDKNYGGVIRVDANLGEITKLASITAYRRWDNRQVQDYDGVDRLVALSVPGSQIAGEDLGIVETRQFSQELRLTSESAALGDYVVGLYFLDVGTDEHYRRRISQIESAGLQNYEGNAAFTVNSQNVAAFGEARIGISDELRILAGGRILHDRLSYSHDRRSNAPVTGVAGIRPDISSEGAISRTDWSGRIGLQYDPSSLFNLYTTLSRGYKGPAYSVSFNLVQASTSPLSPETSVAWELGAKGRTLDGRLSYNLAAFSTRFDGFQANFPISFLGVTSTRLTNAGSIRTRGIELDAIFRPVPNVRFETSAALLDSHIIRFNCPVGGLCANLDGTRLPFAPVLKLNVDTSYSFTLNGPMDVEVGTDLTFKSRTYFQLQERSQAFQPPYLIANAYISLISNAGMKFRMIVHNLTDKRYSNYIAGGNVSGTVQYIPRNYARYLEFEAKIRI